MVVASPRTRERMVCGWTPTARAMRAELWPITCRARSRRRVPPASTRPRGMAELVRATRVVAAAGTWRGVGSRRCTVAGAGLPTARRGDGAGAGGPAGRGGGGRGGGGAGVWPWGSPRGCERSGGGGRVQSAVGLCGAEGRVGLAVNKGGGGRGVPAAGPEVQVMGGQVAVALV